MAKHPKQQINPENQGDEQEGQIEEKPTETSEAQPQPKENGQINPETSRLSEQEKEERDIQSESLKADEPEATAIAQGAETLDAAILEAIAPDDYPASQDPRREEKLKAGWTQLLETLPLLSPGQALDWAASFDPRASCDIDLSKCINLPWNKIPHVAATKPDVPVKVKDTPFKAKNAWLPYAPERNPELNNGYSMRLRLGRLESSGLGSRYDFDKNFFMSNTEESPSYKFIIKLGVAYDNALFKNPYIIKPNPIWVYGHRIKGVHYNHGMEIVSQRVFDIDGEAAIQIRFTGAICDSNGREFMISADDCEYIADIQFTSEVK